MGLVTGAIGPGRGDTVPTVAPGPMVKVATARDEFEARILVARLGSDGIVWELRGNVGGPYPVGAVDVLVAAGEEELARALLVVDDADSDDDDEGVMPSALGDRRVLAAGIVLVLVMLTGLARVLTLL